MRFIFLACLIVASNVFAQDMSVTITIGGESYGDYNFSPFTLPESSGHGGPSYGGGNHGGGFQKAKPTDSCFRRNQIYKFKWRREIQVY